ncbi:MAG: septation protein SpoVG family protein [Elusimicrobia bacterium]|nr:septation protein SpoVG family protein [Elusimicrobiota bacterium]
MAMGNNVVPRLDTRIRVYQGPEGAGKAKLLGFAELVIAGSFVIKDIRILAPKGSKDKEEAFVFFPSRKGSGERESEYFDIAHPITAEARAAAQEAILSAYRKAALRGNS